MHLTNIHLLTFNYLEPYMITVRKWRILLTRAPMKLLPYLLGSVMQYDAYAFAVDRNIPTITAKDGSTLGNTVGFSTVSFTILGISY